MAACRMLGGSSSAPDPLGQAEDGLKKIIFAQTRRIRAPSKGGNSRITSQYFSAADPENPSPAPNCMTRATRQHFFLLFPAPNLEFSAAPKLICATCNSNARNSIARHTTVASPSTTAAFTPTFFMMRTNFSLMARARYRMSWLGSGSGPGRLVQQIRDTEAKGTLRLWLRSRS